MHTQRDTDYAIQGLDFITSISRKVISVGEHPVLLVSVSVLVSTKHTEIRLSSPFLHPQPRCEFMQLVIAR